VTFYIRSSEFFAGIGHNSTAIRVIVDALLIEQAGDYRSVHMSLIHYVKPFLELGICKESCMARKANGTATTLRRKKTQTPDPAASVQVTPDINPDVRQQLQPEQVVREAVGREDVRKAVPKNGTPANHVPVNLASPNIEEQIRRRAYELYLQRRATAGGASGDPNQDWLIAEREILSRQGAQRQFAQA
jgi:hypothetical protein